MEHNPNLSHHFVTLSKSTAASVGSPPSISPEAALPNPNEPPTHTCPNCGFVFMLSSSISLYPSQADQGQTKDGQINTNNSQILSASFSEADADDISRFEFGQRVDEEAEGGWVPDTEEPFDLGFDFGFLVTAPETTRSSLPFPVTFNGEDGGAGAMVEVDGYVSDSGDDLPSGADPTCIMTRCLLKSRPPRGRW